MRQQLVASFIVVAFRETGKHSTPSGSRINTGWGQGKD